jgi:hypothetical protein
LGEQIKDNEIGEIRNIYKILVGKPEGKKPHGGPRHRWEEDIITDFRRIRWQIVD